MSHRNSKSNLEFIIDHILWFFVAILGYARTLFRAVSPLSVHQSSILFCFLVGLCAVFGYFVTRTRHRNTANLLITLMIPCELYAIITYGKYCRPLLLAVCVMTLLVCCAFCIWIFSRPISSPARIGKIRLSRMKRCFIGCRALFALFLFFILPFGIITQLNDGMNQPPPIPSTAPVQSKQKMIQDHIDILCQLQVIQWPSLSESEKLEILQTVADIERADLGVGPQLIVETGTLQGDIVGNYNRKTHHITVDTDFFKTATPQKALEILTHECYHAYQSQLAELYTRLHEYYRNLKMIRQLNTYAEEFESYTSAHSTRKEFEQYYNQTVEVDARSYSEQAVEEYFSTLEKLGYPLYP